jgi:hypothetical protein
MWYPIDGAGLPTDPGPGGNNVPLAIKPEDAPEATDLVNWIQSESDVDVAHTASLGFAPFEFDASGDHRTIVLQAMLYTDKNNVRWGVGCRLILHAWTERGTLKGTVSLVAAQASLDIASTRATFQILGYDSPELVNSLPGFEVMNVENYAKLMKAIDRCRNAVEGAPRTDLKPQPLEVFLPDPTPTPEPRRFPWLHHGR